MKATPITAEQQPWDQLSKSTVDIVDDIPKHFEKHKQNTHNKQVNEDTPVNITSDTKQSNMQDNITKYSSPNQIAVNNEQKKNQNYSQFTVTMKSQMRTLPYEQDMEE